MLEVFFIEVHFILPIVYRDDMCGVNCCNLYQLIETNCQLQVPIGIIFKNENKLDEMVDIMDDLNAYVPTEVAHTTVEIPGHEPQRMQVDTMHKVLVGGDQLTVARMKGAQRIRDNSEHDAARLKGFIPVVEDWHTKVCLLEVGLCLNCCVP